MQSGIHRFLEPPNYVRLQANTEKISVRIHENESADLREKVSDKELKGMINLTLFTSELFDIFFEEGYGHHISYVY